MVPFSASPRINIVGGRRKKKTPDQWMDSPLRLLAHLLPNWAGKAINKIFFFLEEGGGGERDRNNLAKNGEK